MRHKRQETKEREDGLAAGGRTNIYLEGLRHRLLAAIPTWKSSNGTHTKRSPEFVAKCYGIIADRRGTSNSTGASTIKFGLGLRHGTIPRPDISGGTVEQGGTYNKQQTNKPGNSFNGRLFWTQRSALSPGSQFIVHRSTFLLPLRKLR